MSRKMIALAVVLGVGQVAYGQVIYWSIGPASGGQMQQRIKRANLDGTEQETVVSGLNDPRAIAIDAVNERIYWSEYEDSNPIFGSIKSANLDGSDVQVLWQNTGSQPNALALHIAAQKLYWSDKATDNIFVMNLDGTNNVSMPNTPVGDIGGIALVLPMGSVPAISTMGLTVMLVLTLAVGGFLFNKIRRQVA